MKSSSQNLFMSENKNKLTIILPIYNPHKGWSNELSNSLQLISQSLKGTDCSFVLVNDGSSIKIDDQIDQIRQIIPNLVYLSYETNKGKGYAIRYGLKQSFSDYYIYTDCDFPFGEKSVTEVYQLLTTHKYDLVMGVRDPEYYETLPFSRKIISKSVQLFNFFITGFKVKDTQAGLKGFNSNIKEIFLSTKTDSFIFELEFIRKCLKHNIPFSFINISAKEGIKFSNFIFQTLYKELKNGCKLLIRQ